MPFAPVRGRLSGSRTVMVAAARRLRRVIWVPFVESGTVPCHTVFAPTWLPVTAGAEPEGHTRESP
ncbi:hypothetical protein MILUP08_42898 [Micromonospora lupini str. Lupac 08]|uniref:Uncharacterized protein n=1 Tax=Micromonospora lupini str. Lupac 08 TaxID=1150864 RepID=I0L2C0_9ACTN|nr:hypothetical protein MILUP08_42898 [Micromonospora lupini str. Lupac 08]